MLRDYQLTISTRAAALLRDFGMAYLCMEVRTGKTITSLNTANLYGAARVLFVTKIKAIASIKRDFDLLQPGYNLYVCNYEKLHQVDANDFDLVILDEAHSMGAFPTPAKRAKEARRICAGKPIIFLSGTPTPESFSQIYHQLWVAGDRSPFRQYATFYAWAKDYVAIKKRFFYNREVNDYSQADKTLIDEKTAHLFISFTQEQAGFTQAVQEHVVPVRMKESTYALAAKMRARRIHVGRDGEEVLADTEVKLMNKLHQIFSGTVLLDNKKGEAMIFDDTKARYIAEQFKGQKIAVFYKFKAEALLLRWAFREKITESPEEFNREQDRVFISQIQSGREGINLSTADALIMFNIDFSHLSYLQARARMQTRDRSTPCQLYWIVAEGGIEQKIYQRVQSKQDYQLAHFRSDFNVEPQKRTA